jgi:hypothetical protein
MPVRLISTPKSRGFNSTDTNTYRYTWRVTAHVPVLLHGKEVMSEQIECIDIVELPEGAEGSGGDGRKF